MPIARQAGVNYLYSTISCSIFPDQLYIQLCIFTIIILHTTYVDGNEVAESAGSAANCSCLAECSASKERET